jgi:hypothetical protein
VAIDFLIQVEQDLASHVVRRESDKAVTLNALVAIWGGIGSKDGLKFVLRTAAERMLLLLSPQKAQPASAVKQHSQQAAEEGAPDRSAEQVLPSPSRSEQAAAATEHGPGCTCARCCRPARTG